MVVSLLSFLSFLEFFFFVINRTEDFFDALDACKREAMKGFADDAMLIEKFLTKPRHVELQIFADKHGKMFKQQTTTKNIYYFNNIFHFLRKFL